MPASKLNNVQDSGKMAGAPNAILLQESITAFSDEAYTTARKLSGTAIVGTNDQITTDTETYIGQIRWNKPFSATINVASLTDATAGEVTVYDTDMLRYIKTLRTHGARKVNMTEVVTRTDGLAKIGRDFGETRAQDEHDAILSVIKGVAISEAVRGVNGAGGQSWDNASATDAGYGFYVDMGNTALISANGKDRAGAANVAYVGAARAEAFLEAMGKAYKDYEPEYFYLITTPEVISSLRSANLVDEMGVVDGNITVSTIFQGKIRLIPTRASLGFSTAEMTKINSSGTSFDIAGTKTSYLVLPGALAMQQLSVPDPTEIWREAKTYKGGGTTEIWHRWGYVLAPAGYDWAGNQLAFPANHDYAAVLDGTTHKALATNTNGLTVATDDTFTGIWTRKTQSALSLGILPIFHG
jgi:hypothetical protein